MPKVFLFFCLLFIALPGFGQEEDDLIDELEKERTAQQAQAIQLNKTMDQMKEINPLEQIKALGHKSIDATALMDKRVLAIIQEALRESKMRDDSPETTKALIRGQVKGKSLEKLFEVCPKCLDMAADIMRDKEALPSLIGLFARRDDLKKFGWICLALVLGGWIIRWLVVNKEWGFFRRLMVGGLISLSMTVVMMVSFYHHFRKEVGPTWAIIKSHIWEETKV